MLNYRCAWETEEYGTTLLSYPREGEKGPDWPLFHIWQSWHMSNKKQGKRPRPSYEEGRLRDSSIEKKQDAEYKKGDLLALIKKAAQVAHKPTKG